MIIIDIIFIHLLYKHCSPICHGAPCSFFKDIYFHSQPKPVFDSLFPLTTIQCHFCVSYLQGNFIRKDSVPALVIAVPVTSSTHRENINASEDELVNTCMDKQQIQEFMLTKSKGQFERVEEQRWASFCKIIFLIDIYRISTCLYTCM